MAGSLSRYAWLSVVTSVSVLGIKTAAWWVSGSVGLLSDAAESIVNVVASGTTLLLLRWASAPEDEEHPFGHDKAEPVAAAFEGLLLLVASFSILVAALDRLARPSPLGSLDWGVLLSGIATAANAAVGWLLLRAGRRHHSEALQADGHHLLSDVWSSLGVVAGLGMVALTGWSWLDPVVAVLVAGLVLVTGVGILRGAARGLVDERLPGPDQARVQEVLRAVASETGAEFHALRTRRAGRRTFILVHVLVPGAWSITQGHALCEDLERRLESLFPVTSATTHLEPQGEADSFADERLDRKARA